MSDALYSPITGNMVNSNDEIINIADTFCSATNGIKTISEPEAKLYQGKTFHGYAEMTVSGSETAYLAMTTGSVITTLDIQNFTLENDILKIELFEDAEITGGTPISLVNMDRNSSNTSSASVVKSPTVNSEGTLIDKSTAGSSTPASTTISTIIGGYLPWRLKPNTTYLLKFINDGSSDIDVISRILLIEE